MSRKHGFWRGRWKNPGHFSVQGCAEAHREAAAAREGQDGRDLVLPFVDGSNEGGRDRPDTYVNTSETEYSCTIYCNMAESEPVRKGHQADGRTGARVARQWWEQTGVDWKVARERAETESTAAAEPETKTFTVSEWDTDDAMDGAVLPRD